MSHSNSKICHCVSWCMMCSPFLPKDGYCRASHTRDAVSGSCQCQSCALAFFLMWCQCCCWCCCLCLTPQVLVVKHISCFGTRRRSFFQNVIVLWYTHHAQHIGLRFVTLCSVTLHYIIWPWHHIACHGSHCIHTCMQACRKHIIVWVDLTHNITSCDIAWPSCE
jgi:hypothetical protein